MGKIIFNGVDYSGPTSSGVTGVKGNKESSYRIGNVNLTPGDIGALDTDGDSSNTTAEFTEPSSLTELVSGEKHGVSMGKLKLAVKNLIALGKLFGNTDISSIGGGTVTGAINQLNSKLKEFKYVGKSVTMRIGAGIGATSRIDFTDSDGFALFSIAGIDISNGNVVLSTFAKESGNIVRVSAYNNYSTELTVSVSIFAILAK